VEWETVQVRASHSIEGVWELIVDLAVYLVGERRVVVFGGVAVAILYCDDVAVLIVDYIKLFDGYSGQYVQSG
jgi:hypothetical protein